MTDEKLKAIHKEMAALMAAEKAEIEGLKAAGVTVVKAWVHPPHGDDYHLVMEFEPPLTREELSPCVEAELRLQGSTVLTDWKIL